MKKLACKLDKKNNNRICNLFALYDLLSMNGYEVTDYELMLMNLPSLLCCAEFKCKNIQLVSFSLMESRTEIECLEKLDINYKRITDKNLLDYIEDNIVMFHCYFEKNTFYNTKKYYIGAVHTAILYKENGNILLKDIDGLIKLDRSDYGMLESSRDVKLIPIEPNKEAVIIEKNKCINKDKLIKEAINKQLKNIVKSYENNISFKGEKVCFYYGINAYEKICNYLSCMKDLGNTEVEDALFNIRIKVIIKSYISQPDLFQDDVSSAFIKYGEYTDNQKLIDIGNEVLEASALFKKMYDYMLKHEMYKDKKEIFIIKLEEYLREILEVNIRCVKLIKEYIGE